MGLVVVGVLRVWHPLPYYDMWDAYVGFWYRVADGELSPWWAQHNEHRILLARIFFWLDLKYFNGAGWFLIVCNMVAAVVIASILVFALRARLRETHGGAGPTHGFFLLSSAAVSMVSAWMQYENFVWGFQIQFLLASLLPLLAFVLLGLAGNYQLACPRRARRFLLFGGFVAAASIGTMASGLAVPFISFALVLALRVRRAYVAAFAASALGCAILYLHGYHAHPGLNGPGSSLIHHPAGVAHYFITYLGGPAQVATGSRTVGLFSGLAFLTSFASFAVGLLRRGANAGIELAMIAFVGYVIAGGLMTAAGRLPFGLEQAMVGRYKTPVLVGWACLLILGAPRIQAMLSRGSRTVAVAVLSIPVLILPTQLLALSDNTAVLGSQDAAALAIALGVPDQQTISATYPPLEPTLPVRWGKRLMADGLTVLGREPYSGLRDNLGTHRGAVRIVHCLSGVDTISPIRGSNFWRVTGWVSSARALGGDARALSLIDSQGDVVGFVATGQSVRKETTPHPNTNDLEGFVGYVKRPHDAASVRLVGPHGACER